MTEEEKDLTEKQQEQADSDQVENDPRGDAIEGGSASTTTSPEEVDPQAEDAEPDPTGEGQSS